LYKIGSGNISWLEIIEYIISKNKPVFIATGALNEEDVKRVMDFSLAKTKDLV